MSDEVITARVPTKLHRVIVAYCEKEKRSISNVTHIALEQFMERIKKNGNKEKSKEVR